jgi:RND family efflux transporter MFP subunit
MNKYLQFLLVAALVLSLTGCTDLLAKKLKKVDEPVAGEEVDIVIPVEAAYPQRGDISAHFETTTRVQAENRVEVVAEGIGECIQMNVQEGDHVKKGQVLAALDKEDALAALRQLEIQVAQAKTQYEIAETSLAEGLAAKVERDNARFAYEQASASLEAQQLKINNLTVTAPIDGVITRKTIQQGQMVSAGMPVFSLVDTSSYLLEINPPEKELPRLSIGQEALVTIDALEGEEFAATVRRINPSVDPLTGTVKVVLDFDADTRTKLREAAFARVRLVMETHENALIVPKDTLVEENGRKYLFVIGKSEVEKKPGETPESDTGSTESTGTTVLDADQTEPAAEAAASDTPAPTETPAAETPAETDTKLAELTDTLTNVAQEPAGPVDEDAPLAATRVEVETGLEDSNSVEIVSGIDDRSWLVTLGQHTLKPGARVVVTNADERIGANAGMDADAALAAAQTERAKEGGGPNAGKSGGQHQHFGH